MKTLDALRKIRTDGPILKEKGLCAHIMFYLSGRDYLCDRLMTRWPKYSGDEAYPVPHPTMPPREAYFDADADDVWDKATEYGCNRWDLLDWLILQFEKLEALDLAAERIRNERSKFVCRALFAVALDNPKLTNAAKFLTSQIEARLGQHETLGAWLAAQGFETKGQDERLRAHRLAWIEEMKKEIE